MDTCLFDLEGIDLILGISWLATLGEMIVDWRKQTMKFQQNGKWVELKGVANNQEAQTALKSLLGRPKRWVAGLFLLTEVCFPYKTKRIPRCGD